MLVHSTHSQWYDGTRFPLLAAVSSTLACACQEAAASGGHRDDRTTVPAWDRRASCGSAGLLLDRLTFRGACAENMASRPAPTHDASAFTMAQWWHVIEWDCWRRLSLHTHARTGVPSAAAIAMTPHQCACLSARPPVNQRVLLLGGLFVAWSRRRERGAFAIGWRVK